MTTPDPLILTAVLDPATQAVLDGLRRRHFPPERNHLSAHLTLFHHLPSEHEADVHEIVAAAAAHAGAALPARVDAPMNLGRGVALTVDCPALVDLRAELATAFTDRFRLTPQDAGWRTPHVTVQNKVAPARARALEDELARTWEPLPAQVEALALWWYRGGPWEPAARFALG